MSLTFFLVSNIFFSFLYLLLHWFLFIFRIIFISFHLLNFIYLVLVLYFNNIFLFLFFRSRFFFSYIQLCFAISYSYPIYFFFILIFNLIFVLIQLYSLFFFVFPFTSVSTCVNTREGVNNKNGNVFQTRLIIPLQFYEKCIYICKLSTDEILLQYLCTVFL